jgi:hypothetical protein
VGLTRSFIGCLRKSLTVCSVRTVKDLSTSGFVVKMCSSVSPKAFNFSCVVYAVLPLIVRGGIL